MDNDLKARHLRYAKREELAIALRYWRLYMRRTLKENGGTVVTGYGPLILPDRGPLCRREVSALCSVYLLPTDTRLDLRDYFEPVEGVWCPLNGGPYIQELFVLENDNRKDNSIDNMLFPRPATVLFD